MLIEFRRAEPRDTPLAVPLVYSAGPQALDYGFGGPSMPAMAFLHATFSQGAGFFGHRNHMLALQDGTVAAVAASYGSAAYLRLSLVHTWLVGRHFPWGEFLERMRRGLHLQALMPPPEAGMLYFANFGVARSLRGRGIGRAFLDRQINAAASAGCRSFALDVSVENPGAHALYERCGLRVVRRNRFPGPSGVVPDTLRMELRL